MRVFQTTPVPSWIRLLPGVRQVRPVRDAFGVRAAELRPVRGARLWCTNEDGGERATAKYDETQHRATPHAEALHGASTLHRALRKAQAPGRDATGRAPAKAPSMPECLDGLGADRLQRDVDAQLQVEGAQGRIDRGEWEKT